MINKIESAVCQFRRFSSIRKDRFHVQEFIAKFRILLEYHVVLTFITFSNN